MSREELTFSRVSLILSYIGNYIRREKAHGTRIMPGVCALAVFLAALGPAGADDAKPAYPAMAPIEQYRMGALPMKYALARSAAPASISGEPKF